MPPPWLGSHFRAGGVWDRILGGRSKWKASKYYRSGIEPSDAPSGGGAFTSDDARGPRASVFLRNSFSSELHDFSPPSPSIDALALDALGLVLERVLLEVLTQPRGRDAELLGDASLREVAERVKVGRLEDFLFAAPF